MANNRNHEIIVGAQYELIGHYGMTPSGVIKRGWTSKNGGV